MFKLEAKIKMDIYLRIKYIINKYYAYVIWENTLNIIFIIF